MIADPYNWRVIAERPGKRILAKVDRGTGELLICEEFFEDAVLEAARKERERPELVGPDLKPLAMVPAHVEARALTEGWYHDKDQWRKWANDIDNNKLRTSDGVA